MIASLINITIFYFTKFYFTFGQVSPNYSMKNNSITNMLYVGLQIASPQN